MRKLFALLFTLSLALTAAAAGIGQWTPYLSYHNATDNLPVGKEIYSLCEGNLFVYDRETSEVRLLSKLTGLNDKTILRMGYSPTLRRVCLVYDNGNIDLLRTDGTTLNIPQLKNANDGSLALNALSVCGDMALLATGDGFVMLDLAKAEIKNYCKLGQPLQCATLVGDTIFVGTQSEIRYCRLADNYSDPAQWRSLCQASAISLHPFAGGFYARTTPIDGGLGLGLWYASAPDATGNRRLTHVVPGNQTTCYDAGDEMVFSNGTTVRIYHKEAPEKMATHFTIDCKALQLTRDASGGYWASAGSQGLLGYKLTEAGELKPTGDRLGGYGPRRDLCYFMRYADQRLLIAGGRLDPFDLLHYPGTALTYEQGEWGSFQEEGISDITKVLYRDATSIAQDPADATHHYVSTGGTGVYEFKDGKFVRQLSAHNSPLRSVLDDGNPYYVRTDGLNFDNEGNLWMVNNSMKDTVLRVLKYDGTWEKFYFDGLNRAPTCEKTLIDSRGRIWVTSRRTVEFHDGGLLGFDHNFTLDNTADDRSYYRSNVTNQDGTSYSLGGVYAIAEDHDGAIWMGTAAGLFVISNPDEWFDRDFLITQIKVPRNDGTNFADYLLSGLAVTAIAVDGANRKWIGTENNGLYLVSADGLETIHHFRADDSPLLSDCIYSIAPNLLTGEIMIGTDRGLVSYQSEATAPSASLDKSSFKVYPNPVRPEHHGNIVLSGLTADAEVKVVSTGGQVVAKGSSVGGTFVWDGCNFAGRRVATGVYYFMISTADGKKGAAAAVTVI